MNKVPPEAERSGEDAYHRAARFDGRWAEQNAEQAYQRSRRDLHRAPRETDLSVFRLQIGNRIDDVVYLGWYVAVIGQAPDKELETRLERHLARGTPVELPDAVMKMLEERRVRDAGLAPWIERRYGRLTKVELYQRPEGDREHDQKR